MNKEEILRIIQDLSNQIHGRNYEVWKSIDSKASQSDVYIASTDRYAYIAEREMPRKNNSKEYIYDKLLNRTGLSNYFSQKDFEEIYAATEKTNQNESFYFDEEFVFNMKKYIYYQEYLKNNDGITFYSFLKQGLYEKIKGMEEIEAWEKETKEIQANFVHKTIPELREMYQQSKGFIDDYYKKYVDSLDCMDIFPFSEFLILFDMADRNYRNTDALVDHRVMTEIVNKYYQVFVERMNYQEKLSFRDFWKMFNNCLQMQNKEQFKLNITNLVEEHMAKLNENLELAQLYEGKKRA